MDYQEYVPGAELTRFIDRFWIVSNIEDDCVQRIFPEACTNFVFQLGEHDGSSNLMGANTKFSVFRPPVKACYFGVSFYPGVLGAVTGEDFSALTDAVVPLSELFPQFDNLFLEALNEQESTSAKLKFLENRLKHSFWNSKGVNINAALLTTSVANVIKANHRRNPSQIALQHHTSVRQLQRRFKREVGISMKLFSRIVRFNRAIEQIRKRQDQSLLSISFDLGFFDHSHLTNEVRHFAGVQPSELR